MTAPLWFVKYSSDKDVEAGFDLAAVLHADPDPRVHRPVGIYLAHGGERLPERLDAFLVEFGEALPRAAHRIAVRKRGDRT